MSATTQPSILSLHDALPISAQFCATAAARRRSDRDGCGRCGLLRPEPPHPSVPPHLWHHTGRRSEEHTSELQSHVNLVCRLLLEKKKYQPPTSVYRCAILTA